MKTNETNWKKWYLTTLGKEWAEGQKPTFDGLAPEQKAVGELLYRRYIQEKKDTEDKRFAAQLVDCEQRIRSQNLSDADHRLDRYRNETALSQGLAGSGQAQARYLAAKNELAERVGEQAQTAQKKKRDLADKYLMQTQQKDERLAKDIANTQREYARSYEDTWRRLKEDVDKSLPSSVSPYDSARYTQEGVERLRSKVEQSKESLGTRYQDALDYIDALPVYRVEQNNVFLQSKTGKTYVMDKEDYRMADIVRYVKGAGTKVSNLDILTIDYEGTKYYVKPKQQVDAKQADFLTTLAADKQVPATVGAILYDKGALYIGDGKGNWYTAQTAISVGNTLDRLLSRIAKNQG